MPPEERLVGVSLCLEDALMREAWEEADALFAAREELYGTVTPLAVPREVDDIDARILVRLREGLSEVRRETMALGQSRRAAAAYAGTGCRSSLSAA